MIDSQKGGQMNYTRPEITSLGTAYGVIEAMAKGTAGRDSGVPHNTDPAYDLDE
jgi:hypothetical protein